MRREAFLRIELKKNHHKPLFLQFGEALRSRILSGELKEGERLPPLKELAEMTGVSIFTADRGINGLIKDGLLTRRPKKGTYVSTGEGTPAWRGCRRKIIFCVRDRDPDAYTPDSYYGLIFLGMQEAAAAASVSLVISSLKELPENLKFYQNHPDFLLLGVILTDEHNEEFLLRVAREYAGINFVLTNCRIRNFELTPVNVKGVFCDDFGGGYEIASWAISGKHQRVAILSRDLEEENYRERVKGMLQACRENNIQVDSGLIFEEKTSDHNQTLGRRYMERILERRGDMPTLILAVNDFIALGAQTHLAEMQPETAIQFTGFDALNLFTATLLSFPTVEVDFFRIGSRAMEIMTRSDFASLPKVIPVSAKVISRSPHASPPRDALGSAIQTTRFSAV